MLLLCNLLFGTAAAVGIEPIADVPLGRDVTISGTADCDSVRVMLIFTPEYPERAAVLTVPCSADQHRWSAVFNGSLFHPGTYLVFADADSYDPEKREHATLNVTMQTEHQWITIDPISDQPNGSVILFSGKTGLHSYQQMFFELLPVSEYFSGNVSSTVPQYSMRTFVYPVAGSDGENRWNVSVNTASFPPGKYSVRLAAFGYDEGTELVLPTNGFSLIPRWDVYAEGTDILISATQEFVLTEDVKISASSVRSLKFLQRWLQSIFS